MLLKKADEVLSAFWVEIGSDNFNDLSLEELEHLLSRLESFHCSISTMVNDSEEFSRIETDCKAQMSLVIMRQNFLATGKYL